MFMRCIQLRELIKICQCLATLELDIIWYFRKFLLWSAYYLTRIFFSYFLVMRTLGLYRSVQELFNNQWTPNKYPGSSRVEKGTPRQPTDQRREASVEWECYFLLKVFLTAGFKTNLFMFLQVQVRRGVAILHTSTPHPNATSFQSLTSPQ